MQNILKLFTALAKATVTSTCSEHFSVLLLAALDGLPSDKDSA